ncbi:unnamed protein product [Dicrocoelium dendriticum]|nr:unnamed protein product [Dicrocoelium dendriticum]
MYGLSQLKEYVSDLVYSVGLLLYHSVHMMSDQVHSLFLLRSRQQDEITTNSANEIGPVSNVQDKANSAVQSGLLLLRHNQQPTNERGYVTTKPMSPCTNGTNPTSQTARIPASSSLVNQIFNERQQSRHEDPLLVTSRS